MARDYGKEYQARTERARQAGFQSYGQFRRARFGNTARSTGFGPAPDLDSTATQRQVHEAAVVFEEDVDVEDWESDSFASSRVASGRYSPSRRQLILEWTNGRIGYVYDGVPPSVWTGFRSTGSHGQFVNHTLNGFPYRPNNEGY